MKCPFGNHPQNNDKVSEIIYGEAHPDFEQLPTNRRPKQTVAEV